jgi:hypothetical protein
MINDLDALNFPNWKIDVILRHVEFIYKLGRMVIQVDPPRFGQSNGPPTKDIDMIRP